MAKILTAEERAILESRIVEVDLWAVKAASEIGDYIIDAMIAQYRPYWQAEKDKPGYKTAAQRAATIVETKPKLSLRDQAINAIIIDAAQSPNAPQIIKDYAATIR